MKTMIAFDLDGTLAASKQPLQDDMAATLKALLDVASVAVISGGDWPQFDKQVASRLPEGTKLERLFLMPTTGSKLYRHRDGQWTRIYAEDFSRDEHDHILQALQKAVKACGYDQEKTWGQQIEDRGSQITFSALGQEAPLDAKEKWDPDQKKRGAMQAIIEKELPGLSVKVGGSTSIDITREGVDKAWAIGKLCEHSGVARDEILFMGDAIFPGGNDDPVRAAGIDSIKVRDPAETITAITAVVACLK
ncbi:HAD-IIB family hydrolase [Sphingomonas sp. AP4-R1]|uniref:HAD-IIB family hydrolase n=1 Tax=Sphingomonas sp. AP4-R1 TaxID=2735134 RepID=UPI0014935F0D|nr:HAD-IIB family hydrolase [Sphingomonas sp. AP4-R1]QJU57893.1 HAD-IIB family hydrolase [Sphingomonas sp. AP4-R1]